MTDWKRFEDEVPTEDLPILYFPWPVCAGYPYGISNPVFARLHWQDRGWTHWAYVHHAPGGAEFDACAGCNCHDAEPDESN